MTQNTFRRRRLQHSEPQLISSFGHSSGQCASLYGLLARSKSRQIMVAWSLPIESSDRSSPFLIVPVRLNGVTGELSYRTAGRLQWGTCGPQTLAQHACTTERLVEGQSDEAGPLSSPTPRNSIQGQNGAQDRVESATKLCVVVDGPPIRRE